MQVQTTSEDRQLERRMDAIVAMAKLQLEREKQAHEAERRKFAYDLEKTKENGRTQCEREMMNIKNRKINVVVYTRIIFLICFLCLIILIYARWDGILMFFKMHYEHEERMRRNSQCEQYCEREAKATKERYGY